MKRPRNDQGDPGRRRCLTRITGSKGFGGNATAKTVCLVALQVSRSHLGVLQAGIELASDVCALWRFSEEKYAQLLQQLPHFTTPHVGSWQNRTTLLLPLNVLPTIRLKCNRNEEAPDNCLVRTLIHPLLRKELVGVARATPTSSATYDLPGRGFAVPAGR